MRLSYDCFLNGILLPYYFSRKRNIAMDSIMTLSISNQV